MCENILRQKIREHRINSTTEEDIVKRDIDLLKSDANGIRVDQHWENILFGQRYIPLFKKWLFFIYSPYYRETETTLFSLALEGDVVVLECSFWLEEKKYKVDEGFYNHLTDDFLAIINTSEFSEMLRVFNDLANKETFGLTMFYEEYLRYTPKNLYINVDSHYFKQQIDANTGKPHNNEFSVVCDEETMVHQPYVINEYVGKLGEINGFRVICIGVQGYTIELKFVV